MGLDKRASDGIQTTARGVRFGRQIIHRSDDGGQACKTVAHVCAAMGSKPRLKAVAIAILLPERKMFGFAETGGIAPKVIPQMCSFCFE